MNEGKRLFVKSVDGTLEAVVSVDSQAGIQDYGIGETPGTEGPAGIPDSPFYAGFMACVPRDVLGDGDRDIYLVKEVRYAGCTEYNLFMHPNGDKNFAVCLGGFPGLAELKKLGEVFKRDLESGREMTETFRDGAEQIVAAIEKVEGKRHS